MKKNIYLLGCLFLFVVALSAGEKSGDLNNTWPQWRGPTATGTSLQAKLPMEWNEREALVRKRIAEKRAEVEARRAEILKNLGKREWKTIGEPTPHNIPFGI